MASLQITLTYSTEGCPAGHGHGHSEHDLKYPRLQRGAGGASKQVGACIACSVVHSLSTQDRNLSISLIASG